MAINGASVNNRCKRHHLSHFHNWENFKTVLLCITNSRGTTQVEAIIGIFKIEGIKNLLTISSKTNANNKHPRIL